MEVQCRGQIIRICRCQEQQMPQQPMPQQPAAKPASQDNAAQIAYWNDRAAVTWTALQDRLDAMFTPLTAIAIDAAAPATGENVVDVGCGCGATVLQLARLVGPQGRVLGIDVSEPMAARASERIAAASLGNAQVLVSDASAHPFEPGRADLLFSRFGVMFFADPPAAFANLRGAMRPGGRLLFATWRAFEENAWFSVPLAATAGLLPPSPPAEPGEPGPFAFADPDRVRRILETAGWTDVVLTRYDVPMRLAGPGRVAEAAEFATRVGALARALADATAELRDSVVKAIAAALPEYDAANGVCLPGSIWLVSARA
jgi:SAM-dependent methyltransferase